MEGLGRDSVGSNALDVSIMKIGMRCEAVLEFVAQTLRGASIRECNLKKQSPLQPNNLCKTISQGFISACCGFLNSTKHQVSALDRVQNKRRVKALGIFAQLHACSQPGPLQL